MKGRKGREGVPTSWSVKGNLDRATTNTPVNMCLYSAGGASASQPSVREGSAAMTMSYTYLWRKLFSGYSATNFCA